VQTIYDQEQQEIQQAKLSLAFKKLLEVGKFDANLSEFSDFLQDYASRMDDHNFNKNLKQEYEHGITQAMMDAITEERKFKRQGSRKILSLEEFDDIPEDQNELDDVAEESKRTKGSSSKLM
jgi:hypothetical protein